MMKNEIKRIKIDIWKWQKTIVWYIKNDEWSMNFLSNGYEMIWIKLVTIGKRYCWLRKQIKVKQNYHSACWSETAVVVAVIEYVHIPHPINQHCHLTMVSCLIEFTSWRICPRGWKMSNLVLITKFVPWAIPSINIVQCCYPTMAQRLCRRVMDFGVFLFFGKKPRLSGPATRVDCRWPVPQLLALFWNSHSFSVLSVLFLVFFV